MIMERSSIIVKATTEPAGVAEWQTHQTQNLTWATTCGFKSHLLYRTEREVSDAIRRRIPLLLCRSVEDRILYGIIIIFMLTLQNIKQGDDFYGF